jgi:DNA-binding MarR family transcriptional regulator
MSKESKHDLIERLIYAARASEAATDAFDEAAFDKLGVNATDGRCLGILDNEGAMTAGRLAELSGLTTAAVTAVLDRLERAGYARRRRDDGDRRRVIVELTPTLRERSERIWGPIGTEGRALLGRMSSDELRAALAFLEASRELNRRHVDRVRQLRFDAEGG